MVAGVILAAGASTRMGRPKQLLDWGGVPLIRHVAQQALRSQLARLYIVIGAWSAEVTAALEGLPVTLVSNDRFAEGQSTSLQAGVAALPPEVQSIVILLGDQPFITPMIIDRLIDAASQTEALIVAPEIEGRRANPVVFKAALRSELSSITGDEGARQLIAAHREHLLLISVDDTALAADLDTPADYERLRPR